MPKTYITDITHFLDEAGELAEMPGPARKMASFLILLIDAATAPEAPAGEHDTPIRCGSKRCHGHIRVAVESVDDAIEWNCPECGQNGVIRNWQATKWDRQRELGRASQPRSPSDTYAKNPAAEYTPRQGQFLAFIYYYTKLHRLPPAESEMQQYFGISAPAVHQMVLTLEKRGLIERQPGVSRSIRLLLPRNSLPDLE